MRRIDALFLKDPFYGARHLGREGARIGRRRAGRLMRLMGLQAIYRAPRISDPHPEHRVYPYLLKGLTIERANQVWCADITYIPVRCGFLYLVAIMDWASRHVLAWRLSNTLDAGFCVEALDDALARHSPPEIFNTDQGSQFTSVAFTGRLQAASIQISMDGRGRCMDNIFIERLWRSLKYGPSICMSSPTASRPGGTVRSQYYAPSVRATVQSRTSSMPSTTSSFPFAFCAYPCRAATDLLSAQPATSSAGPRPAEIGYLPIERQAATLFFQLISRRYERGPMLMTSNQSFGIWSDVFGDHVIASAILDRTHGRASSYIGRRICESQAEAVEWPTSPRFQ